MSPQQVLSYIKAEPFRPFQIRMVSGRTFDIRHPKMVRLTASSVVIFSYVSDTPDIADKWDSVSLLLIESISHLETHAA